MTVRNVYFVLMPCHNIMLSYISDLEQMQFYCMHKLF